MVTVATELAKFYEDLENHETPKYFKLKSFDREFDCYAERNDVETWSGYINLPLDFIRTIIPGNSESEVLKGSEHGFWFPTPQDHEWTHSTYDKNKKILTLGFDFSDIMIDFLPICPQDDRAFHPYEDVVSYLNDAMQNLELEVKQMNFGNIDVTHDFLDDQHLNELPHPTKNPFNPDIYIDDPANQMTDAEMFKKLNEIFACGENHDIVNETQQNEQKTDDGDISMNCEKVDLSSLINEYNFEDCYGESKDCIDELE